MGNYEEALKCYEKALEIDPSYKLGWLNTGSTLATMGRYDEALKSYDEAVRLEPNSADAWYNRAVVLGNIGNRVISTK